MWAATLMHTNYRQCLCTFAHMHAPVLAFTHACMRAHTHAHTHARARTHTHTHTHSHTRMHTHTHTHTTYTHIHFDHLCLFLIQRKQIHGSGILKNALYQSIEVSRYSILSYIFYSSNRFLKAPYIPHKCVT